MKTKLHNQDYIKNLKRKLHKNYLTKPIEIQSFYSNEKNVFSSEDRTKIVIEGQSREISINEICVREGITPATFYQWSLEFIRESDLSLKSSLVESKYFSDDDKFRIVLEGNNGEYSIAEICRKENITHEQFLKWSNKFLQNRNKRLLRENIKDVHTVKVKELIDNFVGKEILDYFESFIDVTSKDTIVIRDENKCKDNRTFEGKTNLVCLSKVNNIRHINKHFEFINNKLPQSGIFIGCFETFSARKIRKNINKIPLVNSVYFSFEFLFKRIIPKLSLTKRYYFDITKGNDRLISKAETLGRLVSSGFKIMDYNSINGLVYFVVKKVKNPAYDQNPSYGPVYRMPRIGKDGKIIKVYKFRTMHPYSEYLQDFILRANGYAETGKPAHDFRIPKWGKFMRRFWLDELPQLINVLKGEMKLVGIRPVSERYFKDIPKEMQKLRLTQKPGCIPPYVALNREGNVMSVLHAEKEYLEEKIKHPYTTDTKYFFKAIINILFKHKRSA